MGKMSTEIWSGFCYDVCKDQFCALGVFIQPLIIKLHFIINSATS